MSDRKQPTAGKGDKPRTINNQNWRQRYDDIDWGRSSFKVKGFRGKPPTKIPDNKFGIFAIHDDQGIAFTQKEIKAIIDGPIAAMEDKLQEELAKPVIVESHERPNI